MTRLKQKTYYRAEYALKQFPNVRKLYTILKHIDAVRRNNSLIATMCIHVFTQRKQN